MKHHSPRFLALVAESKKNVNEITPQKLKNMLDQNEAFTLIDVREDNEWPANHIPTAIHLSRGVLERDIEKLIPDPETTIVLYCSGGFRCAMSAESLQKMGYSKVFSLDTGLQGWKEAGYSTQE